MDPLLMFIYECHSQKSSDTGTVGSKKTCSFSQYHSLSILLVAKLFALCAWRQSGFTIAGLMHSLADQLCIDGGALGISWNKKDLS